MNTFYQSLILCCLFLSTISLQAQQNKWEFGLQYGTSLYSPPTKGSLEYERCGIILCDISIFQIVRLRERRVLQFSTAYKLGSNWSIQTGLINDDTRFELSFAIESFSSTPVITFNDWLIPLQVNYQVADRLRFGLGSQIVLGQADPGLYLPVGTDVRNESNFYVYFLAQYQIPIFQKFDLRLGTTVIHKNKWYLQEDIHLEANLGVYYSL